MRVEKTSVRETGRWVVIASGIIGAAALILFLIFIVAIGLGNLAEVLRR